MQKGGNGSEQDNHTDNRSSTENLNVNQLSQKSTIIKKEVSFHSLKMVHPYIHIFKNTLKRIRPLILILIFCDNTFLSLFLLPGTRTYTELSSRNNAETRRNSITEIGAACPGVPFVYFHTMSTPLTNYTQTTIWYYYYEMNSSIYNSYNYVE